MKSELTNIQLKEVIQSTAKRYLNDAEKIMSFKNKTRSQLEQALEAKTKADALYDLLFKIDYMESDGFNIKPCGGD